VKSLYSYIWDVKLDFDLGQLPLKWHCKHSPIVLCVSSWTEIPGAGSHGHLEWVHLVADNTPLHKPSTAFPPLLRPTRLYSFTAGYYMILVFDLLARGSWALAISVNGLPPLWSPLMALVEVIRRGLWMLLRTEHELVVVCLTAANNILQPSAYPSALYCLLLLRLSCALVFFSCICPQLLKQTIPSAATPDASPAGTPRAPPAERADTNRADA
jgi:hypothetical protein